jgi:hypothetical protein
MRFGTRVDWLLQGTAITGVRKPEGMQFVLSTSHLEVGEGVTPCSANQAWMLDYRCDGTAYPDTRLDLRLLIKPTMF